jgi:DNA modification methylase
MQLNSEAQGQQIDIFGKVTQVAKRSMRDYFLVPPFSVLNTMDGKWQARKKQWQELINDEGQARAGVLAKEGSMLADIGSSSILDAVLAELMVRWFTLEGWAAFDPFAGDTVFGFVCGYLGRPFTGIELRKEQADFNQAACNAHGLPCLYHTDTSENMNAHVLDGTQDFMFTCPPYADLEVYSDDPKDLSTMPHTEFFTVYRRILQNTYLKLKPNRFAVVVTSDVRGKDGAYIRLANQTIDLMVDTGFKLYNELILVNSVGTLALRSAKSMNASRKVGRQHQNVLVFYKGDTAQIKHQFGELMPRNNYYEYEK